MTKVTSRTKAKNPKAEPVTRELTSMSGYFNMERGQRSIRCECGGYAGRTETTKEEMWKYGCGRSWHCCDVAFTCDVCGTRWVGMQPAPEMGW